MGLLSDETVSKLPPRDSLAWANHWPHFLAKPGMVAHPRQMLRRCPPERAHLAADAQLLFWRRHARVLLLQNGHGDRLGADIAGFIMKGSRDSQSPTHVY